MSHRDRQSEFIRHALQTYLPGPATVAIGTPTVSFDGQARRTRIPVPAYAQPPRPDSTHGKISRLMRSADHDIALISIFVIDAVGISAASGQTGKVVVQHIAILTPPSTPTVLEIADQLLLLRIYADYRPILSLEPSSATAQEAELSVPLWVLFSPEPLTIRSQRVFLRPQQAGYCHMTRLYATLLQCHRQLPGRLVRPPQAAHRIAGRGIPQQFLQQLSHARSFFSTDFRPPPGRRTRSEESAWPRSLSRNPRRIVTRLSPVISAASWTPPRPRCLANIPANSRRLRSSNSTITRLIARWYATNSASLRDRHPRQRQRWTRLRFLSAMTVTPSLDAEQADYSNGQLIS